jgi:general secretion pathway protein C
VANHFSFPGGFVERLGVTRLSQTAMIGATALSLAALALTISATALQGSDYATAVNPAQQFTTPDLNRVSQAHLFGRLGVAAPTQSSELPSTQLQWVLQGVFTGGSPQEGSAIILAGEQSAQLYKTEQQLPGGATLTEVHADHVVLNLGGRLEKLRFPSLDSIVPVDVPARVSPESLVNSMADDTTTNRREIVRQRLEMLRQRALGRP